MERPMRLANRALDEDRTRDLLESGDWGVLSTVGRDAVPYGVPVSYVMLNGHLYVHGSNIGHKVENIGHNPRVSFCVVGETRNRPEMIDRDYESVILFGRAAVVTGPEKRQAMEAFMLKYTGPFTEQTREHLEREIDRIFVFRVTIERTTGKAHKAVHEPAAHS